MVQVDVPAAFAVGQVFALLSKDYLRRESQIVLHRLSGPFNFYLACGFVPGGLYLLIGWPAWEVMYATPWLENPFDRWLATGAYVAFMVLLMAVGNLGFMLAHRWYRKGKDRLVVWGAAMGTALALLPFLLRWGVWWTIGTYDEIQGGQGYSFWSPPFFKGWLTIMSYLLVASVLSGWWFLRTGRRLAQAQDARERAA